MLEAIDPNWDPDEIIFPVLPPICTTGTTYHIRSGMDPEVIQDSTQRAEYKEALRIHRQKVEERTKQRKYHKWLKKIPRFVERHIIPTYSHPPFAIEELRAMLDEYILDQDAKARIIEAVEKNMQEWSDDANNNR